MSVTIGIDIGGSATKIAGFINGEFKAKPVLINASDPLTSLFGAFGKFITINNLKLQDVSEIMITGLGVSHVKESIYGIPTYKVGEFLSIGLGGLFLSELEKALVVSMGTGTAFVWAEGSKIKHMGGSGVGGGTLSGLSSKLFNSRDINYLMMLAENGNISNVDLCIKDVTTKKMALSEDVTVSNFGKASDMATQADIALGLFNMTFQTIGVMSYFLTMVTNNENVVLTGKLSTIGRAKELFDVIGDLYKINFTIPTGSEFATAAGAALAYIKGREFVKID